MAQRMRGLRSDTQHEYIRFVRSFATFLGQPPDTATAEDIRRFHVHQRQSDVQPPTIKSAHRSYPAIYLSEALQDPFDFRS